MDKIIRMMCGTVTCIQQNKQIYDRLTYNRHITPGEKNQYMTYRNRDVIDNVISNNSKVIYITVANNDEINQIENYLRAVSTSEKADGFVTFCTPAGTSPLHMVTSGMGRLTGKDYTHQYNTRNNLEQYFPCKNFKTIVSLPTRTVEKSSEIFEAEPLSRQLHDCDLNVKVFVILEENRQDPYPQKEGVEFVRL